MEKERVPLDPLKETAWKGCCQDWPGQLAPNGGAICVFYWEAGEGRRLMAGGTP